VSYLHGFVLLLLVFTNYHALQSYWLFLVNPVQVYLKKHVGWYNLPHSGKFVPPTTKAYPNVLGAQARVWTTQERFPNSFYPFKKKVVACRKILIIARPNTTPLQKTRVVQLQREQKIHENIRNSASNLYWRSVKDHSMLCSKLVEVHAKKVN